MYELNLWEERWLEQHEWHTGSGAEYVTYGDLSNDKRLYLKEMKEDSSWESDSDTEYLVGCCNKDRSPNRENIATLAVKPSTGNSFVTVHNYLSGKSGLLLLAIVLIIVSAVHLWLISLREDILTAMRVGLYYPPSLPTELMVTSLPGTLIITDKKSRIQRVHGSSWIRPVPIG